MGEFIEDLKRNQEEFLEILARHTGLDITDENFTETPYRVAKSFANEKFIGINSEQKCSDMLQKSFTAPCQDNGMVIVGPIKTFSTCPHHFENVRYKVYMGYIPSESIVGISKFSRVATLYAKQPILQEKYTSDLADMLMKVLKPEGCMVLAYGQHDCTICRGVEADMDHEVITSAMRGCFETPIVRSEFMNLVSIKNRM